MIDRPLLLPLAALIVGILLAHQLWLPLPAWVVLVLFAGLFLANLLQVRSLCTVLSFLFWAACGMAALATYSAERLKSEDLARFDGRQVMVEGVLASRPVRLQQGQRIDLRVETVTDGSMQYRSNGRLLVTVRSGFGDWHTGDRIRMPAVIKVPRLLGLPGEFQYPRYLALQGYQAVAWVRDADRVVLIRGAVERSFRGVMDRLALRSQEVIRASVAQSERRGVLLALATGTQHELAVDQVAAYTRAGVNHILSVSGFHVGIVAALWVFVIRWLLARSEWLALRYDLRRVALLSALPLMLAYLLFTGAAWATTRSVLMLSLFVIALWLEREADPLDALLAAGFLLLLLDPACLFDISFQLSFMALWGLIVLTPLFLRPFERWRLHGWRALLLQSCAASLAATAATLVPVLVTFHQASLSSLFANLLVVPLLGYGATVLATAAVPLTLVAPAWSALLLVPAGWLVAASNAVIDLIAHVPVIRSYRLESLELFGAVLVLSLISFVRGRNWKICGIATVVGVLLLGRMLAAPAVDGTLQIHFLSVGQGDSTLIRLPDGRTLLVDGGGYLFDNGRDFGERYLVPALHRLGVRQIDTMVLTHAHPDHLGGLPAVAEQFRVREFWQGNALPEGAEYRRLVRALERQRTSIRTVRQGERALMAGDLEITVRAAPDSVRPAAEDDNDDSLVLQLRFKKFSALLMGDAGVAVEEQLMREGIGMTTLLKVGHHGSRTSTGDSFLRAVRPEVAVLSVGAGNRFGLPAAETLYRLQLHDIRLYRTDLQGTIRVSSDGTGLRAEPLPREHRLTTWLRCFVLTGSGCCDNN